MNIELLEKRWDRQIVVGSGAAPVQMLAQLRRETRGAHRRIRGAAILAVAILVLGFAVTATAHATGIKRLSVLGAIDLGFGSVLYVLICYLALRSARIVRIELERMGESLKESAHASLHVIDVQLANYRAAMKIIPIAVLLAVGLSAAKMFAGELSATGAVAGGVFFATLGAAIGAAGWNYRRKHLLPRQNELQRMIREFEDPAPDGRD